MKILDVFRISFLLGLTYSFTAAHWTENNIIGPTCSGIPVQYQNVPEYHPVVRQCDKEPSFCRALCILSKLGMVNEQGSILTGKAGSVLNRLLPGQLSEKAFELSGAFKACWSTVNYNEPLSLSRGCANYAPLLNCFRKSTLMICEGVHGRSVSRESASDPWPAAFIPRNPPVTAPVYTPQGNGYGSPGYSQRNLVPLQSPSPVNRPLQQLPQGTTPRYEATTRPAQAPRYGLQPQGNPQIGQQINQFNGLPPGHRYHTPNYDIQNGRPDRNWQQQRPPHWNQAIIQQPLPTNPQREQSSYQNPPTVRFQQNVPSNGYALRQQNLGRAFRPTQNGQQQIGPHYVPLSMGPSRLNGQQPGYRVGPYQPRLQSPHVVGGPQQMQASGNSIFGNSLQPRPSMPQFSPQVGTPGSHQMPDRIVSAPSGNTNQGISTGLNPNPPGIPIKEVSRLPTDVGPGLQNSKPEGPPPNVGQGPSTNVGRGPPPTNVGQGPPPNVGQGSSPTNSRQGPPTNVGQGLPTNVGPGPPPNAGQGPPQKLDLGPQGEGHRAAPASAPSPGEAQKNVNKDGARNGPGEGPGNSPPAGARNGPLEGPSNSPPGGQGNGPPSGARNSPPEGPQNSPDRPRNGPPDGPSKGPPAGDHSGPQKNRDTPVEQDNRPKSQGPGPQPSAPQNPPMPKNPQHPDEKEAESRAIQSKRILAGLEALAKIQGRTAERPSEDAQKQTKNNYSGAPGKSDRNEENDHPLVPNKPK